MCALTSPRADVDDSAAQEVRERYGEASIDVTLPTVAMACSGARLEET